MKRQERIDRIELMRTYIRIVEAGSLSAAAGQMDTTQATVSRRLQSLEGLLGVKLILRTTHAMKLTDDGERCYRHARQVVDAGWRWRMTCVLPTIGRWAFCECGRPTRLASSSCWRRWWHFYSAIRSCRWSGC